MTEVTFDCIKLFDQLRNLTIKVLEDASTMMCLYGSWGLKKINIQDYFDVTS